MTNIIIKNKVNESFKAGDIAIFAPNDEKFTANYLIIGKPYRIDEINERGLLKILDEAGGYGFYSANHFKPLSVVQNEIAKLLGHKLSFTAYSGIGFVHGKELIADSIKEKITEAMQQNPKSQNPTKKLALVKKVSLSHEGKILMLNAFVDYEEGGSQNACGFVLDTYSKELGERIGTAGGLDLIKAFLDFFGVQDLNQIKNILCYVLGEGNGLMFKPVGLLNISLPINSNFRKEILYANFFEGAE